MLKPVFDDAKRYLFNPLIEIEYAHTLMLARQQIMPLNEAAVCLRALDALDHSEVRNTQYDGSFEDLFFLFEKVAGLGLRRGDRGQDAHRPQP